MKFSIILALLSLVISSFTYAGVSSNGISGLINIPDGRVTEKDFWTLSYSKNNPYNNIFTSINLLPRMQLSAGIVEVPGVAGFANNQSYGNYKDKIFNTKLLFHREDEFLPSISVGANDFHGTGLFKSNYLAMSKKIGNLDVTLGYGADRIDGVFGGLRYTIPDTSIDLLFEKQTINNDKDFYFQKTGENKSGGNIFGLEYHWGWLDFQANHSKNAGSGFKMGLNIPFSFDTFIPNYDDKNPIIGKHYLKKNIVVNNWKNDLYKTLDERGFNKITLTKKGDLFQISASHGTISKTGKVFGRIARIFLHHLPINSNIKKLKVVYLVKDMPLISMQFDDIQELEYYLNQKSSNLKSVKVFYESDNGTNKEYKDSANAMSLGLSDEDVAYKLKIKNKQDDNLEVDFFNLSTYLNDPSEFLQYELYSTVNGSKRLAKNLFLDGGVKATLYENISKNNNIESNSELPHVRSDIAKYKQQHGIKLNRLLLNNYNKLTPRLFSRTSLGYYEEMFAGFGAQLLYLPKDQDWAFDVAVDKLKQRDYEGKFKLLDYGVTTSIVSAHYHYKPLGLRLTARAGQFLAKDEGVRLEMSRRFQNGVRMGFWYSKTNGNDITSPGSISNPYHDKGISMSIPFNTLLTKDTKARANMSISPWARDVGQMVASPNDLYQMVDKELQLDKFNTQDYTKQLRE